MTREFRYLNLLTTLNMHSERIMDINQAMNEFKTLLQDINQKLDKTDLRTAEIQYDISVLSHEIRRDKGESNKKNL